MTAFGSLLLALSPPIVSVIVISRVTAGVITDVSTNDVYASRFWPGSKAVVWPCPLVSGVARIRVWVGKTKNPSAKLRYFGSTVSVPSTAGVFLVPLFVYSTPGFTIGLAFGVRRELQDQVAFLGHRHRDRVPRPGRDAQRRAVAVDGPADLCVGVAVLPDDRELRVVPGGGLGQSDCHVGDVADVGHHPDLRLARLDLQLRLELAVDGELHVALDCPAAPGSR